jgi:hypothetical protein
LAHRSPEGETKMRQKPDVTAASAEKTIRDIRSPKTRDPQDLSVIQNVHIDDFYKGLKLSSENQILFEKTGYIAPRDYVAPDGQVYRRTASVRPSDNPLSGVINSILRDANFDPRKEMEDLGPVTQ